ncbi:lipid II flippase MurJ [Ignavibacterium sp.]|uniref:murein biosynthesis integral membrane protein MurJ n=1 Tax=Ignavibacterium sp. TaxID=2651167 RepID=UPI00307D999B
MKKISSIGTAAIVLTLFGFLSKATGFFREILFANYFGLSRDYEFYLVASIIPITLNSISLYIYQNYFIPTYSRQNQDDNEKASQFVKRVLINSLFISVVSLLILIIFRIQILEVYIGTQFISKKTELLFIIFSCTVPFGIISGFLTAYLQTKFNFKSPAIAGLMLNIFTIIALLVFKESNIIIIALAYFAGIFVQTVILFKVSKIWQIVLQKFQNPLTGFVSQNSPIIWIILIEVIGQLYVLSDRYFLSKVDQGGIAAINYATTIFLLPISIITISISTAILPKFSQLASSKLDSELKTKLSTALTNTSLIFIPITFLFIFFGREVIRILFERGNFNFQSTQMTYEVLFYLSLSLLFYSLYGILNKIFYVYEMVRTLFFVTVLGVCVKLLFNFILVDSMKQNGLVISTSSSYIFFFIMSVLIIHRRLKILDIKNIFKKILFYTFNGLFSLTITKILIVLVNSDSFLFDFIKIILFLLIFYTNNVLLNDAYQKKLFDELIRIIPQSNFIRNK